MFTEGKGLLLFRSFVYQLLPQWLKRLQHKQRFDDRKSDVYTLPGKGYVYSIQNASASANATYTLVTSGYQIRYHESINQEGCELNSNINMQKQCDEL